MSKNRNRNVPKTVNLRDAAFAYFSTCCNAIGEKPACSVPQNARIGTYIGAVPPEERQGSLGSWRCSTCKKPCKVQRTAKKEVPVQTERA